ncbi:hypothetical protein VPH35_103994 [Triticum aestivum]
MAAMRVDRQILEEHLVFEATVDTATRETMRDTAVYHRGPVVKGLDPLFDPFCIWGNEMSMNISQVKKLRKIVRMKKLATNNSKIFVCKMKVTSVNYRMLTDDHLSNHLHGQEARKANYPAYLGFSIADGYSDSTMGYELKQPTWFLEKHLDGADIGTHGNMLMAHVYGLRWRSSRQTNGVATLGAGLIVADTSTAIEMRVVALSPRGLVVEQVVADASTDSIGIVEGICVDVDARTEAMAEPLLETASCVREFTVVEWSPEMPNMGVGLKATAAGSRSKQPRSGTTPMVTLDEANVEAGVGADTDMVMAQLGHCIEHVACDVVVRSTPSGAAMPRSLPSRRVAPRLMEVLVVVAAGMREAMLSTLWKPTAQAWHTSP